jgi:hypothetical protein
MYTFRSFPTAATSAVEVPAFAVAFALAVAFAFSHPPKKCHPERSLSQFHRERRSRTTCISVRMQIRRFTRLTNAFSKKMENHEAAVALHFMHYNYCRVQKTLRVTPAMGAGISVHVWSIGELVSIMPEPVAKKRRTYKPRQK